MVQQTTITDSKEEKVSNVGATKNDSNNNNVVTVNTTSQNAQQAAHYDIDKNEIATLIIETVELTRDDNRSFLVTHLPQQAIKNLSRISDILDNTNSHTVVHQHSNFILRQAVQIPNVPLSFIEKFTKLPKVRENILCFDNSILRFAAQNGNRLIVEHLLTFKEVRENAAANDNDALIQAITGNHVHIASMLTQIHSVHSSLFQTFCNLVKAQQSHHAHLILSLMPFCYFHNVALSEILEIREYKDIWVMWQDFVNNPLSYIQQQIELEKLNPNSKHSDRLNKLLMLELTIKLEKLPLTSNPSTSKTIENVNHNNEEHQDISSGRSSPGLLFIYNEGQYGQFTPPSITPRLRKNSEDSGDEKENPIEPKKSKISSNEQPNQPDLKQLEQDLQRHDNKQKHPYSWTN